MSTVNAEFIKRDPALFIEAVIKDYIATSPNNRMPDFAGEPIWDEPLIGFSRGDDPLFEEYKTIIGSFHMTPREALERHLKKKALGYYKPQDIGVVSFVLPATRATRESMQRETEICSLRWNRSRWFGQEMIFRLERHLVALLEDLGYHAVAPDLEPWFEVKRDVPGLVCASSWSQRHVAYVAGLGTFSLNDSFITPKGSSIRLGSIVCDISLPATPRPAGDYRENCLFASSGKCGVCIKRCPVGAIDKKGHDKVKCNDYLNNVMPQRVKALGRTDNFVGGYIGCGFCQTGVPCEECIPAKPKKKQLHMDGVAKRP